MNIGIFKWLFWMFVLMIFLGWRFFLIFFNIFLNVFFNMFLILIIFLFFLKKLLWNFSLYWICMVFIVLSCFLFKIWILNLFFCLVLFCLLDDLFNEFIGRLWMREFFLWKEIFEMFNILKKWVVDSVFFFSNREFLLWKEELEMLLKFLFCVFSVDSILFSNVLFVLGIICDYFMDWMFWNRFCLYIFEL